jgi:hypothetical protein
MNDLQYEDVSDSHRISVQKCLKRLFCYRAHAHGTQDEWEPKQSYSVSWENPRDYLTREERTRVRDAALEYGSVPRYSSVTPETNYPRMEMGCWGETVATMIWTDVSRCILLTFYTLPLNGPLLLQIYNYREHENIYHITTLDLSLIWASLDAGLRPVEVERCARTYGLTISLKRDNRPKDPCQRNSYMSG